VKQFYLFNLLIFLVLDSASQSLAKPLNIPLCLAGNYAELRKNHFHMGLDFKTDNRENLPVFSAEDGYVSRILISSNGYGKALYVNHPRWNITTVYAHLNEFDPKIQDWIDKTQYALKKNTIDTSVSSQKFLVKKGQQIAKSGNTGGSHGPHLHYDELLDTIKPTINKIIFYQMEDYSSSFHSSNSLKEIQNKEISLPFHHLGIAISALDKSESQSGILGIYSLKIFENNQLKYRFQLDSLDFSWQSHIKAISDYGLDINDVYKGFVEHCSFNISDSTSSQNGIITLDNHSKEIRIEVRDFGGNLTSTHFKLKAENTKPKMSVEKEQCDEPIVLKAKDFILNIPAKSIAENFVAHYRIIPNSEPTDILKIQLLDEATAVLKPYQLTYTGIVESQYRDKLYIDSRVDAKHKSYLGTWSYGKLHFPKIKNFGTLTLRADIHPPIIQAKYTKTPHNITFNAIDNESEIDQYKLTINGEWRKLYFDEKNDAIIYEIISSDKGKKVNALIEVTDKVGNKNSKSWELNF
jgi:Peptidase family M23